MNIGDRVKHIITKNTGTIIKRNDVIDRKGTLIKAYDVKWDIVYYEDYNNNILNAYARNLEKLKDR